VISSIQVIRSKLRMHFSSLPYVIHARLSHPPWFNHTSSFWWRVNFMALLFVHLDQHMDQWRAFEGPRMNLRIPQKVGCLLSNRTTSSFSMSTLPWSSCIRVSLLLVNSVIGYEDSNTRAFIVYILLCIYFTIFIYHLVSLHNNFYNKTNITVSTFVFIYACVVIPLHVSTLHWVYISILGMWICRSQQNHKL
jgi:hypothetical protein